MAHLARIQRIIDFIEEHLEAKLSVVTLARQAGYSPWHFQHIFSATAGEPVADYIRSRRLTRALIELQSSDLSIVEIARQAGFKSQAAFSRAFKGKFAMTPAVARKKGVPDFFCQAKPRLTFAYLKQINKGGLMNVEIVELKAMTMIGLITPFISVLSPEKNNMKVIPPLWEKYLARRHEIQTATSEANFGVCEPAAGGHEGEALYYACTEVSSNTALPAGMVQKQIPAGRYARFLHRGPVENIEQTVKYIYGSWLPRSKYELRSAPDLERYDHRFIFGSEDSELELYIPIK